MKEARLERDWTKGSILGNLLSLSWPIVISSLVMHVGPIIDMIWVGKLGATSVAAVGVASMTVAVVNAMRQGFQVGTRAMVSRFVGQGDNQGANHVAQQTLVITVAFGVLMAAVGFFFSEPILRIQGVDAGVVAEGSAYMRIQLLGTMSISFALMNQSVMQASGDAITPMVIDISYRLFHILLCPFLVFGWWVFPRLSISGAAISNVIAQSLGASIGLFILFSGRSRLRLTMRNFHIDWNTVWILVKIGMPAALNQMQRNFGQLVLLHFIAPFGTIAVAAHSLTQKIDGFLHMPASGLGQSAGVLAGQNLGAGQPKRAETTGWLAVGMYTSIMIISSSIVWFWSEDIVRIFSHEPNLVEMTSIFITMNIVIYLIFGIEIVLMNCLNGVGDTMIPMLTSMISLWIIQTPLAFFMPQITDLGVYGVRWAIIIGEVLIAVTYAIYFKAGKWKYK